MGRGQVVLLWFAGWASASLAEDRPVDFKSDVAPILVQNCLACHGPKKAFANYRVDTFTRVMADSDAGQNIEPGKPDDSLFFELIVLTEPTGRMPKNSDPLTDAEIATLRRWIEQGAKSGGLDPSANLAELVARGNSSEPQASHPKALPISAGIADRELSISDPPTLGLIHRLGFTNARFIGSGLAVDRVTHRLALAGFDGSIRVYDIRSGRELARFSAALGLIDP